MKHAKPLCGAVAIALAALLLAGCGERAHSDSMQPKAPAAAATPTPAPTPEPDPAQAMLANMSLREKVGQLFIVRPDSLDFSQTQAQINDENGEGVTEWNDELRAAQAQYPVGGFALFRKNITDPEQLTAFNAALAAGADTPPLLAVDEEGGLVARLANHPAFVTPQFESAAAIGEQGSDAVFEMSAQIGAYIQQYGFNLDFAPVADVNSNPDNVVIGTRAFSDDAATVAQRVSAAVDGFHSAGMLCTIKHFPGHGDTAEDSHEGSATANKTWEEMLAVEIPPFTAGIAAGADCVMVAHINTPNATDDGLPATLSHTMLTDRLRGELGFEGVIITDSMAMQAITEEYEPLDACKMALQAGADVLLMPTDFAATFDGLVAAVEAGEISEARLDESVARILKLKMAAGLL